MGVAMAAERTSLMRRLRRAAAGAAAFAFAMTTSVVIHPNVAGAATPEEQAISDGLEQLMATLGGLDNLDELGSPLPLTELLPTGADGLDLAQSLIEAIADLGDSFSDGALESHIESLGGTTAGGVDVAVDASVSDTTVTLETFTLTRTVSTPLAFVEGGVDLEGGTIGGTVVLDLSGLVVDLDDAGDFVVVLPFTTGSVTADLAVDFGAGVPIRLGIIDTTVTGTAAGNLQLSVGLVDSDGDGQLSIDELVNVASIDLFDINVVSSSAALNVTLTENSGLIDGVPLTGTITYLDSDLSDETVDQLDVDLPGLGDFTNLGPEQILVAIAQLAVSLQSMQTRVANPDLPVLGAPTPEPGEVLDQTVENLADLIDVNAAIGDFFVAKGLARPESPFELLIGDTDGDGIPDVDLDALGLETVDEIITALAVELGDAADLDYADGAITFDLAFSDEYVPPPAEVKLNDQLADLGLAGLVTTEASAGVAFDSDYVLDVTFGIDLENFDITEPLTDFLFLDTDGTELTGNTLVYADLALGGTIGFLEVELADDDSPSAGPAGFVEILGPRAGDSTDMVTIDVDGGPDDRITLTELYGGLGSLDTNLVDNNQFVIDGGADLRVTGVINAAVPDTTLAASATIGSTDIAGAEVTFGWPDILNESPTLSGNTQFNDDLLSFNIDPENPLALFNSIVDAVDIAIAAVSDIEGDVLDEELPVIGTSVRDSVAFLDDVRDSVNDLAQDPAGSLQRFETDLEIAIAEALGVDTSAIGDAPDSNDAAFISDNGTPADPTDDFFDDDAFRLAIDQYLAAVEAFLTANDYVQLEYVPGNSPGAVVLTLDLGVCSSTATYGGSGCTREIPIESEFNVDTSSFGDLAGLVAADGEGTVMLDYNAGVTVSLGVELPDVANDEFVPKPFVDDSSGVNLSLAGLFDGAFSASIGPFEVEVGAVSDVAEDCGDDVDNDGDGSVNDGCPTVGDAAETGADCANATDDDPTDDDTATDPPDDGDPSAINDGCTEVSLQVQAKAGAAFAVAGDVAGDRAYLFPEAGEPGIGDLFDSIDFSTALTPNAAIDCGNGVMFACASLPLRVNAGGSPIHLGTIELEVTDLAPFTATVGPPGIMDDIKQNLLDNADALAFQLIGQGLIDFGDFIESATDGAAYDLDVPVVGDVLDGGAEIGAAFNDGFANPVGTFLQTFDPNDAGAVADPLRDELFALVGPAGADLLRDGPNADGAITVDDISVAVLCQTAPDLECDATNDVIDIVDIAVAFEIGETIAEAPEIPFDFGFPGLRLATADGPDAGDDPDGIRAAVEWSIDVGFGLSLDEGFYLSTGGTNEIELEVTVDTPDFLADIAFLGVAIDGDNSETPKPGGRQAAELSLRLAVDLPDPSNTGRLSLSNLLDVDPVDLAPTLTADVDIYWRLATAPEFGGAEAGDGSLPTVYATLDVTWSASLGPDGFDYGGLNAAFQDVELDLGSFINDFLDPILEEVTKFTKPLQPVIDIVSAPIPGISQLAELVGEDPVTMITLFEAISGNDLTLIKTLLDVITFINAVDSLGDAGEIIVPIGSFTLAGDALGDTELPANQKGSGLIGSQSLEQTPDPVTGKVSLFDSGQFAGLDSDFTSALTGNLAAGEEFSDDVPGFTFPAFEDLSNIFKLLVGEDITLVRFASGPLKAEFGFSQSFGPIAVGPVPVSIVISGSAAIEGRFAVGYDTKGIRQLVQAITDDDGPDVSFLQGFGFLFNGLFLDDLNSAGQDVPEIRLTVEFAAGAAVDLVIISAGVEGGVRATLDLNLHDGGFFDPIPPDNLDGKLRLDEIASFIFNNPICLFDVSGKLTAFVRIFVEIDLFLFSKRFEFTVVNITLLELDNITAELCEPPEPVLGVVDGAGVLTLNIGTNAGNRGFAEDEPDEKFIVRQLDDDSVLISAFGFEEVRDGVTLIIGDAAGGNDSVQFEPGSIESVEIIDGEETVVSEEVEFVIPTVVCGGPGDDKLSGGNGVDRLGGDGSLVQVDGQWTCSTGEAAGDGLDEIGGNGGGDVIWGHGEVDNLNGGSGDDEIDAGGGNDQANGDLGGDTIDGGPGDDILKGGADADPLNFDIDPSTPVIDLPPSDFSDDIIDGGIGDDTIEGDWGDDIIDGGDGDDVIVGGFGNDTVDGGADQDTIYGDDGDDPLSGGTGDDVIFGMRGDDTIDGGEGNDNLIGNEGDDDIGGGPGLDIILGDSGTINRNPLQGDLAPSDPALPLVTLIASTGAAGDTILDGGDDDDVIYGQSGDDTINGGGGNDLMFGDVGVDTMSGDAGEDTMFGDNDADVMYGDNSIASNGCADGNDTMRGGPGADTMSGNAGADDMRGDSGSDTMYGDAVIANEPCDGVDTIRGLADGDDIWGNGKGDLIQGDGGNDQVVGGNRQPGVPDGADSIDGNAGDDVIAGDNADITDAGGSAPDQWLVELYVDDQGEGDTIGGDDGDDRIYGQVGADALDGDAGADSIEGNDGGDTIDGGAHDDDLVGGSSALDGVNDDGRNGDGALDAADTIDGGNGVDFIAGDNAWISRNVAGGAAAPIWLFDVGTVGSPASPGTSGADTISGDADGDQIFGQGDADIIGGDGGDDYIEGNDGDDTIDGDAGNDDIVGGGSANDGVIDADRVGDTLLDVGETLISGGAGVDYIAGDNALMSRVVPSGAPADVVLFDVETVTIGAMPGTGGGEALIDGGSGDDLIFGQTGDDTIEGGPDQDYVEGNNGEDAIDGGSGDDDLVGGGSAVDGVIDDDRSGNGLLDDGDDITGNGGQDWLTGDNALVNRNVAATGRAPIELFDVEFYDYLSDVRVTSPQTGGADTITGDGGNDRLFGQTDDDDLDAGTGDDYVEGNNGVDTIVGGVGDDDLIGGGSADDGVIDGRRIGNTLLDEGENVVTGGVGDDWITGDNALINRNVPAENGPSGPERAPIELFDVQTSTGPTVAGDVSGGDLLQGGDDEDRIFGQGNGFQPADQTDPVDGRNNDFNGAAEGSADFDRLAGTADEDGSHQAGWLGDTIVGGGADDEIEGNHGNDLIYGDGGDTDAANDGEDDIAGGGSADDGKIWDDLRVMNGAHLLDGSDVIHGDDADATEGNHDGVVGDNGWVGRTGLTIAGDGPEGVAITITERLVTMVDSLPDAGTFGDDYVAGNGGHDELYGQAGDDTVEGEWGSDAMVGDLGRVTTELLGDGDANALCGEPDFLEPRQPFVGEDICVDGTLFRQVLLYGFDDTQIGAVEGSDVMLGGDGDDWMHGGAGADLLQGDGDGGAEIVDPDAAYTTDVTDPNPASADKDRIFGGDSNGRGTVDPVLGGDGDASWGGRGDDYTWAGNGDDMIDVRPDGLYPATWAAWAEADVESYHGVDVSYGGWDQDAAQANVAANGPIAGDRILDWAGVYNISYLCPATYGAYVTVRGQPPSLIQWVIDLAEASGAIEPGTPGTSGYNEVAMVYKPDVQQNTNPIYPGTPGHFSCTP